MGRRIRFTKENDNPLIDTKTKIRIGLVTIGGLLFMCLQFALKAILSVGICCLIYGLFLFCRGDSHAKTYTLIGAGIIAIWFLVTGLSHFLKARSKKQEEKRLGYDPSLFK